MSTFISQFKLDSTGWNNPLKALYQQLVGMEDLSAPPRKIFKVVRFTTNVARLPKADEMPECRIMTNTVILDSESQPLTLTQSEEPVSLYIWFRADDQTREEDIQYLRNDYVAHILSRLEGTVSGITDSTGITPDGTWEFNYAEGSKITVEYATPFDNLGWPVPIDHPNYCVRIDIRFNTFEP